VTRRSTLAGLAVAAAVLAACDGSALPSTGLAETEAPDRCVFRQSSPPGSDGLATLLREHRGATWLDRDPRWATTIAAVARCGAAHGWNGKQRQSAMNMAMTRANIANRLAELQRYRFTEAGFLRAAATLSDADLLQAERTGKQQVDQGTARLLSALAAEGVRVDAVSDGADMIPYIVLLGDSARYEADRRRFAGRITTPRPDEPLR